jgi:hypothetical protein
MVTREDRFAEYLAQGLDMPTIRERMGLSRGAAQGIMRRLRIKLGPQAI